jgi:hypothetical protein
MMTFQEVVEAIDNLSTEDRDRLFELIRQQKVEEKEAVILANGRELKQTIEDETAKQENSEGFWDMTVRFRELMERENIVFNEEDFADLRDRSVGKEVILVTNNVADFQFFKKLKIENWFIDRE